MLNIAIIGCGVISNVVTEKKSFKYFAKDVPKKPHPTIAIFVDSISFRKFLAVYINIQFKFFYLEN